MKSISHVFSNRLSSRSIPAVKGFTLAELLVALLILAEIATFTIPKILGVMRNETYKSSAKETAAAVSEAYHLYKLKNQAGGATRFSDLTPYLNYVTVDTSGATIDMDYWNTGATTCNGSPRVCLRQHNGSVLQYDATAFGGTAITNMIYFRVDPDGRETQAGSPANGEGKSVMFFLYFNGRLTTYGECLAGTTSGSWAAPTCPNANPGPDPTWFDWD